jgi:hypothetical protein
MLLKEDLNSLECATFKQEYLILDDLVVFVILRDSIS